MTEPPPPCALPDTPASTLTALEDRHLARRKVLMAAVEAEAALRACLVPPPTPPTSWWTRIRQRWSPTPSPVTAADVAERYERLLRTVRPLAIHLIALEQAVTDADLDVFAARDLAAAARIQQIAAPSDGPTAARLDATAERSELLLHILEAEATLLTEHHATLVELHHAANDVVRALGRQALAVAAGQATSRHTAGVDAVVRRAIERAAELHHRADAHEARLAELDAEAHARLAAQAEVDGWLTRRFPA